MKTHCDIKYIKGDIHEVIKSFDNNSIDLIYTDPPFNTTLQEWDKSLNWEELFKEMWRVLSNRGVIILHSALPFSYELYRYEKPKYNYIWRKINPTGYFHAKKQPLRDIEEINVYYKNNGKGHTYNPQMRGTELNRKKIIHKSSKYYGERKEKLVDNTHYGQYPRLYLGKFPRIIKGGKSVPKEIIEEMINTYSNEGDKILDMTCHNSYVGEIVNGLNRQYIGVDINLQPDLISATKF